MRDAFSYSFNRNSLRLDLSIFLAASLMDALAEGPARLTPLLVKFNPLIIAVDGTIREPKNAVPFSIEAPTPSHGKGQTIH